MRMRNNKKLQRAWALSILVISFFLVMMCRMKKDEQDIIKERIPATKLENPIEGGLQKNEYFATSVPTQAVKVGEDYFIVDCYHNQILYSQDVYAPLDQWLVLTNQINQGHTIASDGIIYLADDTENHRVLIFEKIDGRFYQTQMYDGVGERPHFVEYDKDTEKFYVLSSMTGEMYIFSRDDDDTQVYLDNIITIPEIEGVYVRSFTISDEGIYFVACNGTIYLARKKDLKVVRSWNLPSEIAGTVQLKHIEDYFYLTVSTDIYGDATKATFLRAKSLNDFENGKWESIYDLFNECGTLYYMTTFDGHYYLTKHYMYPGQGLWEFDILDDEIINIRTIQP